MSMVKRYLANREHVLDQTAIGNNCPSLVTEYVLASDYDAVAAELATCQMSLKIVQNAAKTGMDAAHTISSHRLESAKKLHAESSPDALESERAANAMLTDRVQALEAIAFQALTANKCWICPTVLRGKPEFVAAYASAPYGGNKIIRESFHADPWVCLSEGLRWLDAAGKT